MDADELAGRIEAVSKFVLQLAAEMEMQGLMDGAGFTRRVRGNAGIRDQVEFLRIGRDRLDEMLDRLDEARGARAAMVLATRMAANDAACMAIRQRVVQGLDSDRVPG